MFSAILIAWTVWFLNDGHIGSPNAPSGSEVLVNVENATWGMHLDDQGSLEWVSTLPAGVHAELRFGQMVKNGMHELPEYRLQWLEGEAIDHPPDIARGSNCGIEEWTAIGGVPGLIFHEGGATWCRRGFMFTKDGQNFLLQRFIHKDDVTVHEDVAMRAIIESLHVAN